MRPLSLALWLALEDDVARHKAEITRQFAEARARLLPEPAPEPVWECPAAWSQWNQLAAVQEPMLRDALAVFGWTPQSAAGLNRQFWPWQG